MRSVEGFLREFGLAPGTTFSGFAVKSGTLRQGRLELELADPNGGVISAQISQRDPNAEAFLRTASFDLAHGAVPDQRMPAVLAMLAELGRVLGEHDRGDAALPREWSGEPTARDVRDFVFVDVDASDLEAYSDAMHAMFERRLDVMIIRNVFSPEQMARVTASLEASSGRFAFRDNTQTDTRDHAQPYNLGMVLIPTREHPNGAPLDEYFATARSFRETSRELFASAGDRDFETRVSEVLRGVAGGRPVGVPAGPAGESYTPATIRAIPPGAELAVHVGNYFKDCDAYRHLMTLVDTSDQLSYFIPLATPEAGGEIEVYSLEWFHRPLTKAGALDVELIAKQAPSVKYRPGAGDMFLFDGGYWYHRVCPVVGARNRWTIGGFVTIAKDHRQFYYWS